MQVHKKPPPPLVDLTHLYACPLKARLASYLMRKAFYMDTHNTHLLDQRWP